MAACTKNSKIIFGVAVILGVVGAVLLLVAHITGDKAVDVDFVVEGKTSFTLNFATHEHCGYSLWMEESGNCEDGYSSIRVVTPSSQEVRLENWCSHEQSGWAKESDPPLRETAHFGVHHNGLVPEIGDYTVTSTPKLWAVDLCGQIGEAVGGLMAALGIVVVAAIVFVVSCILCCVGCCCMDCNGNKQQTTVVQGGTVVGQPQGAS